MSLRHPAYQHDEWLWPVLLVAPAGMAFGAGVLWTLEGAAAWPLIVLMATLAAVVALLFGRLRIESDARTLRWQFGFLGWPGWQLALDDVIAVERAKARFSEGAGIRRTAEGPLYRALAPTVVRLHLRDGRRLRLGTPEPQRLIAFLEPRLGGAPPR